MTNKEWTIFQFGKWVAANLPADSTSEVLEAYDKFAKLRLEEIIKSGR